MIGINKGVLYWALLLLAVSFAACTNSREKTYSDYDAQFLDKYSDEYLATTLINYPECIQLVHPETKDKVRHIRIGHSRENVDYSKLLEFANLVTLQSHGSIGSLSDFSQFKNLEMLMVYDAYIGKYNFSDLAGLTKLEYIDIILEKESEIDFSGIENLKNLKFLCIGIDNAEAIKKAIEENRYSEYMSEWEKAETTYKNIESLSELTGLEYPDILNKLKAGSFFEIEESKNIYEDVGFMRFSNATITNDYYVPDIKFSVHGGDEEEEQRELILENDFRYTRFGIQIYLKNDIPVKNHITVVLKNTKYDFREDIDYLSEILGENAQILGYSVLIRIEEKPWLNDETNKWRLIVMADTDELMNKEFEFYDFTYLFFDELDENPFIANNIRDITLNKKYTYRFKRDNADILVLYNSYYVDNYVVYSPMLYLIPFKDDNNDYTDVQFSWNDASPGQYYIGQYKLNDLPVEGDKIPPIYDFIVLR